VAAPAPTELDGTPPAAPAAASPPAAPEPEPEDLEEGAWPEKAIDTVTGLRAQRRELKTELRAEVEARQKLEAELAAAKAGMPPAAGQPQAPAAAGTAAVRPGIDPVLGMPEIEALTAKEAQENRTVEFCSTLLRRASRDPEGTAAELAKAGVTIADPTPENLAEFLENARENARQKALALVTERTVLAAEARRNAQAARAASERQVQELAPELKDPKHPRSVLYAQTLETFPALKTAPAGGLIALVHTLGLEQLQKLKPGAAPGPNGNGAPRPAPPPPRGPRPANAPSLPGSTRQTSGELFKKFQASGKPEDRAAWIRSTLAEAS
jgi:hypothetical protein